MGSKELKPETLDFILEYTKGAPEQQLRDSEALDSKFYWIFTVANVLIGLIGFGSDKFPSDKAKGDAVLPWAFGTVFVAYFVVAVCTFLGVRLRQFQRSLQADQLWNSQWENEVKDIKHALVTDISAAYAHNKDTLEKKGRILQWALIAVIVQVMAICVFIFWFLFRA